MAKRESSKQGIILDKNGNTIYNGSWVFESNVGFKIAEPKVSGIIGTISISSSSSDDDNEYKKLWVEASEELRKARYNRDLAMFGFNEDNPRNEIETPIPPM